MSGRFVRIFMEPAMLPVWGIQSDDRRNKFVPLWSSDMHSVVAELGENGEGGLTHEEQQSVVDAEECDTPDEAWAALAEYRLTVC